MRIPQLICGFACGCAATVLTAAVLLPGQQDHPGQDPGAMQEMEQKWAEAMAKYCTPAEEHELLAKREGQWDVVVRVWMLPDAPPEESKGFSTFRMIMDGRYLFQEFQGDFEGTPFEGGGLSGFDRMKNKYVAMWVDNMSTAIMTMEGKAVGENAIELVGEMPEPILGKYIKTRSVERMPDDDTIVMEMHQPGPDGKEFKSLEITYTRVKE
jgi:hypothetical protein